MYAVLSPLRLYAVPNLQQPRGTGNSECAISVPRLAPILCGGGLIAYGLWRGSWLGLTLAAAGGFLLYRGLAAALAPVHERRAAYDDSYTEIEDDWVPAAALPVNHAESLGGLGVGDYASPNEADLTLTSLEKTRGIELTAQKHDEAEAAAYYCALRRGGGQLPRYEYAEAVEDFCWAVEIILCQPPGD